MTPTAPSRITFGTAADTPEELAKVKESLYGPIPEAGAGKEGEGRAQQTPGGGVGSYPQSSEVGRANRPHDKRFLRSDDQSRRHRLHIVRPITA